MNDRPTEEGSMFFVGMKFHPTANLKQTELNRLVPHILRFIFMTADGDPLPIKEHEKTMATLVQFLVDLDIRLDEKSFALIPEDLRKNFKVIHRDGTQYQYGSKPRVV